MRWERQSRSFIFRLFEKRVQPLVPTSLALFRSLPLDWRRVIEVDARVYTYTSVHKAHVVLDASPNPTPLIIHSREALRGSP